MPASPISRILWVSQNTPESYEYGVVSALSPEDEPNAHQTAEILCSMRAYEDPIAFLNEAIQYTIHPVTYPEPPPQGGRIMQYDTAQPPPYPLYPNISVSEEEWSALVSAEYVPHYGSPVVEEFLQGVLPLNTPAEDRQGWYEFLCEGGGGEECWTKFLGGLEEGENERGTGGTMWEVPMIGMN